MNVLRLAVAVSIWLHSGILANGAPSFETVQANLRTIAAPELPMVIVKLIQQSPAADREATTISVVRAAVDLNPASAPQLVGAVARALPELAAIAAATAAARQPAQADAITRAAVTVAPAALGRIVTSVCNAAPNEFRRIALAAEEIAPNSRQEIIGSIGSSLPELKPYLDRETRLYGHVAPPVALALDRATIARSSDMITNAPSNASPEAVVQSPSNPSPAEKPDGNEPKGGGNGNGNGSGNGNGNGQHGGRNYAKP
jgi:hypothetical protein